MKTPTLENEITTEELKGMSTWTDEALKVYVDIANDENPERYFYRQLRFDVLDEWQSRGNYANRILYTDVEPNEIVNRISEKTVDIRGMIATLDPTWEREFIPGGFCGHTPNNHSQRWDIVSDDTKPIIRIRKHVNGQWKDKHGDRYSVSQEPCKHHDYNF